MTIARAVGRTLLVAASLLVSSSVFAERPRVVILAPSLAHPTAARVRDELTVLGFDVRVEVDAHVEPADTRDLAAIAKRSGAAAIARVASAAPTIDLWVDAGGAPAYESLQGSGDPSILALRAVELLRARLLHVPTIDAPLKAPLPATAPPPAKAPRETASLARPADAAAPPRMGPWALIAGPAWMLSPGGVPSAFHLHLGAEWDPSPRVGLEIMAFIPTAPSTVTAPEGTTDLRILDFGGGIRGRLTDPQSDLGVALGLGLSAMMLIFEGHARAPFRAESGARWAASPYGSISASYRLHPRFAVRLDVVASLVRPEPVIRIAGRDIASFGQPAVFSSLGLEVRP